MALTYAEIHPRMSEAIGPQRYVARRHFSCRPAYVGALRPSLIGTYYPFIGGSYRPICTRVRARSGLAPGKSLVIADYETPRVKGKCRYRLITGYDYIERLREPRERESDKLGKVIVGPADDYNETGQTWRNIEGTNRVPVASGRFIMETVATKFDLDTFLSMAGTVNKSRLRLANGGGTVGAEKLLLLDAPETQWWEVAGLWYINYMFAYSGKTTTWNQQCVVQKGVVVYKEVPVFVQEKEGILTGEYGRQFRPEWVPGTLKKVEGKDGPYKIVTSEPETRAAFLTSNYRNLPGWP